MVHTDIDFAADDDVRISALFIGEEVECENHGAIGAVFEWHNAEVDTAVLYRSEDVFDCGCCMKVVRRGVKGSQCCLRDGLSVEFLRLARSNEKCIWVGIYV